MDPDNSSVIRFFGWRPSVQGPKPMCGLEQVIIRTSSEWSIEAQRIESWPGVWVGAKYRRKSLLSGSRFSEASPCMDFALNVTMDLSPFHLVTPCGIQGCRVTSMADI